MRRRRDTDKWELRLIYKNAAGGDPVDRYYSIEAKTQKQAEKKRDELIVQLELEAEEESPRVTVEEYMDAYIKMREQSGTVEPSTIQSYKKDVKRVYEFLGEVKLSDLTIDMINEWLASMNRKGYAPATCTKSFRLLKMGPKHAVGKEMIPRSPCEFRKPPKRRKTDINALDRDQRSKMLTITRPGTPTPLNLAIEIALTTGMRRGEV